MFSKTRGVLPVVRRSNVKRDGDSGVKVGFGGEEGH